MKQLHEIDGLKIGHDGLNWVVYRDGKIKDKETGEEKTKPIPIGYYSSMVSAALAVSERLAVGRAHDLAEYVSEFRSACERLETAFTKGVSL